MLVLGSCIHNEGYLKGVASQPEPVLGPEIAQETASAIWGQNRRGDFQGTSHIPTSTILCHFHILSCCLAMTAKQHGRIWKWMQNNLEIYRNLKGTIYTSPVQKHVFGHICIEVILTNSKQKWNICKHTLPSSSIFFNTDFVVQ